jgi:hypothetical protein
MADRDWLLPYPFPPGVGLPDSPGLKNIIPAYLYDEYSDDDDLQAFTTAQNELAQQFLDWFNTIDLPVYTSDTILGLLLDWVGAGLYGMPRPSLSAGSSKREGSYATFFYGQPRIAYGMLRKVGEPAAGPVSDDIYKRVLTWHFFKADGKYFIITWLKKRVMRFLIGVNGSAPNIDQTHQISVTFGPNRQANIVIYNSFRRSSTGPGVYGRARPYGRGPAYGLAPSSTQGLAPFSVAAIFKKALDQGVLELPFQWNWTCTVIG